MGRGVGYQVVGGDEEWFGRHCILDSQLGSD